MDWRRWSAELQVATLAAFDELSALASDERIYAVCLQTDDGAMSVGPCANSEDGYAARIAAEDEAGSAEETAYYRWAPAEWRYEMFGDAAFEALNTALRDALDDPACDFEVHFAALLDAMADALAHLRAERSEVLADTTLFVTISDSEETEAVEDRYAVQLNPPLLARAFLARYG